MRATLVLPTLTVLLAACGVPAPVADGGVDAGLTADAGGCQATGQTCDSVAGDYTLNFEHPDGCLSNGYTPRDFALLGFDGGTGTVSAFGSTDVVTRSGCSLLVPLISSSPLSLTYDPACRDLRGTWSCTGCDGGTATCRYVARPR
jgi:hypothetical protein